MDTRREEYRVPTFPNGDSLEMIANELQRGIDNIKAGNSRAAKALLEVLHGRILKTSAAYAAGVQAERERTSGGPLDRAAEHNDRIADIAEMILDTGIDIPADDAWDLAASIDAKFIPAWRSADTPPKRIGGDGPFASFSRKVLCLELIGANGVGFYSYDDKKWRVEGEWRTVAFWMPLPGPAPGYEKRPLPSAPPPPPTTPNDQER